MNGVWYVLHWVYGMFYIGCMVCFTLGVWYVLHWVYGMFYDFFVLTKTMTNKVT